MSSLSQSAHCGKEREANFYIFVHIKYRRLLSQVNILWEYVNDYFLFLLFSYQYTKSISIFQLVQFHLHPFPQSDNHELPLLNVGKGCQMTQAQPCKFSGNLHLQTWAGGLQITPLSSFYLYLSSRSIKRLISLFSFLFFLGRCFALFFILKGRIIEKEKEKQRQTMIERSYCGLKSENFPGCGQWASWASQGRHGAACCWLWLQRGEC